MDEGRDFAEIPGANFLVVRSEGVTLFASCDFRFLNKYRRSALSLRRRRKHGQNGRR